MAPLSSRRTITSTILTTIMAATSMIAAGTTAVNFSDKGQPLHKYAQYVSELIAKGEIEAACKYTQRISTHDDYLISMEKESKDESAGPQTTAQEKDNSAVDRQGPYPLQLPRITRLDRQVLELLKANVQLLSKELSQEQWLEIYEDTLNAHAEQSGYIADTLLSFPENTFPMEMTATLCDRDIPVEAREVLVAFGMFPEDKATNAILSELHRKLSQESADLQTQKSLLGIYVRALKRRRAHQEAHQVLDNLIKLFPDTELGIEAARLRQSNN